MSEPIKICPECGVEYRYTAVLCSDCDVELVYPEELEALREAENADAAALSGELTLIRVEGALWIDALAERLDAAGITFRTAAAPDERAGGRSANLRYALFVRPEDAPRAREIDREHLRDELPDLPDDYVPAESDDACPACGAACDADAEICPDCGLVFAPEGG